MTPEERKEARARCFGVCLVPKPDSITENSMLLSDHSNAFCGCEMARALDALDEAEKENKRLREALGKLVVQGHCDHCLRISREALKGEE